MSLENLQNWLLDDGIQSDLDELTRRTVISQLDNCTFSPTSTHAASVDWQRLLLAGSLLARSDRRRCQEAALRIATAAVTLSRNGVVGDAGAVLLGKLSNSRAIALAAERQLLRPDLDRRLGTALRIESQRRQMDQAVLVESTGRWLQVNRFQQRFWSEATDHHWLSASAPTASGKTFVILQWVLDQIRLGRAHVTVYLAPTRALVSEIESSLLTLLGSDTTVKVSSLPLRQKYDEARAGGPRLILVFTQERLHLLANVLSEAITIDLLVVDEAHKIGDTQRGVILQDAIERVGRANPALRILFISPATENPEELLADAPTGIGVAVVNSDVPTVLQNLILASQVPRKSKLWNLSIRQQDGDKPLGVLRLANSPAGLQKQLAFIAAAVGQQGGTLVYANRAADSEKVADLISQLLPASEKPDSELVNLADLARKAVHPQYRLAPLVERGVAFHYGNMPSLIRLEIERLFRSGKIRFLVCTSTLIEGVNLSCRTIVLQGPRKGIGHPMEPHDFWNLAGRAGRWGHEFQGNIICVNPQSASLWPSGIPVRSRYPIMRESDAVIRDGGGLVDYLERRATANSPIVGEADHYEQVGAYLLATHLRLGSIAQAGLAKRHEPEFVARLDRSLAAIASKIDIGAEIAGRHPGVSAIGLQSLLDAFRGYEGDIENLLPAAPDSQDSYDRFVTVMRRVNKNLFPAFMPEGRIPLYALIVVQWLRGFSLATMIRRNIEYHREHEKAYTLPVVIRQTMELVEQVARFKAPKYLAAYVDVLNLHLRSAGRADLIETGLDIGTQLEFGVSSRTLLSLMELGLSRMSAVALYEQIARDDLSREECLAWADERRTQFEGMDIPSIILREIRQKLLPTDGDRAVSGDVVGG
jgi:superfamily II DNA/RNA helicase